MKKITGIILLILGAISFIGMFASSAGPISMDNGIAYFIGRLSPIFMLIIGYLLVRKRPNEKD